MIQTLIDILRREKSDLAERILREERSAAPDAERIRSLRDEVDHIQRQIARIAER